MRKTFYSPTMLPLTCVTCGETKPAEEFSPHPTHRSGRNGKCKPCVRAYYRVYKAANRERILEKSRNYPKKHPEKARSSRLKSLYGIDVEGYNALLAAQDKRCAICGKSCEEERRQQLCVDHDHETGKVRGLLCDDCNNLLGRAHDDFHILYAAVGYLHKAAKLKEQVS